MEKNNEQQNIGKYIIVGAIIVAIIFLAIIGLADSDSYYGSSSYNSSGSSSSGSSSYKSSNPADYDSKGNYKPVETMTQEEKRQELIEMLEDKIY